MPIYREGVSSEQLLNQFRTESNNPAATEADMFAAVMAQRNEQRVSVPLTVGKSAISFPKAFPSGVAPIVLVEAETPDVTTYYYDATVIEGSTTNTGFTVAVRKINSQITLPGVATALLNLVINVFGMATGTVTVKYTARPATA